MGLTGATAADGRLGLTVLGSSGSHPGPDRACAAHLVIGGGAKLLLDCGSGSLTRLLRRVEPTDLDGVVLSHRHPDHVSDLWGLRIALQLAGPGRRLPVWAPAGTFERMAAMVGRGDVADLADVLDPREAADGDRLEVGALRVDLAAVDHPVPTLAASVALGGRRLVYSADTAPCEALDRLADGCDLLLCEATWLERDGPFPDGLHMTAAQAGELAGRTAAGRLVLTHLGPGSDDRAAVAEASGRWDGPTAVATDLDRYEV